MGVYVHTLKKSQSITTKIDGAKVKILNLGYVCRLHDSDPYKAYCAEGKREGALNMARIERAKRIDLPDTILYAVDLKSQIEKGYVEDIPVFQTPTKHPHDLLEEYEPRVWYDCDRLPGEWIGNVSFCKSVGRKRGTWIFESREAALYRAQRRLEEGIEALTGERLEPVLRVFGESPTAKEVRALSNRFVDVFCDTLNVVQRQGVVRIETPEEKEIWDRYLGAARNMARF